MTPHYRHTQVGWMILGALAAVLAFVGIQVGREATAAIGPLVVVSAILVLGFCALSVEIDGEAIRLRFGIGLIRKRIPLAEVKAWEAVRNPWTSGWGIRLGPGYVLWNVSGRDAVELSFASGRRFRIGTDEPAVLASAIERAKGEASAVPAEGRPLEPSGVVAWKGWVIAFAVVGGLVAWLFWSQMRPAKVAVSPAGFTVETLFYGASFEAGDITAVALETQLPRILLKTHGFGGAGTLRGRFRVEGLGEGHLYVEEGYAPYVLVRLRQGFVVVNFREPEKTKALYESMARAWPDHVESGAR